VEYGASFGLEPADIAEALIKADIQFEPDPDKWPNLTKAIYEYSQKS